MSSIEESTPANQVNAVIGDLCGDHVEIDAERLVIDLFRGDRHMYEVDLERCQTPAQALDWLAQVARKTWITTDLLGSLVIGIDVALDPQSTLCGCGIANRLSLSQIRRLVPAMVRRFHRNSKGWDGCLESIEFTDETNPEGAA